MRTTRDDIREAVTPDRERNRSQLDAFCVVAWRWVLVIVVILALGAVLL
jgi:hypothetical protein